MRIVKVILIVIGALILLWVTLNSIGPKESVLSRSTTIDASKDVVWSNIKSLQAMDNWGPWMEMDPSAEGGFEGPEGEVGSVGWWKGEEIGQGNQTISEVIPYESMSVDMQFMMGEDTVPSDAMIAMAPTEEDQIEVVWSFHMDLPWMWRAISLFMGDGEAGMAYEKGLANLKELCESIPETEVLKPMTYEVRVVEREEMRYLGIRKTVAFEDMSTHFQEYMPQVGMATGEIMTGPPAGLFWTWDEETKESDMAVAAVVSEGLADGMEVFELDGGMALMVAYYGAYDANYDAHMAIDKHMKDNGMELGDLVIEEYVTDPGNEPDTAKWLTNIYYMVK